MVKVSEAKDLEIKQLIEGIHIKERELFYKNKEVEQLETGMLRAVNKNDLEKKVRLMIRNS
jgi:hypothetical protein